jgi:hypothetical protein
MKGVAIALVAVTFLACFASGNPPLKEPEQYEQFCNNLLLAGNGKIDMSTSMLDKKIAMEYFNELSGQGLVEMDMERDYSQVAKKVARNISLINETKPSKVNLFESSKITYSGLLPLISEKYIHSKEFYGGIGAIVAEKYSANQLEEDQKVSYGSTDTATGAHLIGVDTKSSFNGSWQTDSSWHKIFYKDIKSHQSLSGTFEIDRQVKLHEEETHVSSLEVIKTPLLVRVNPGEVLAYEYLVKNTGQTKISGLALQDSDLGRITLSLDTLNPGQVASGKATYMASEDDLLEGPRETTANVAGADTFGESIEASNKSWIVPEARYYPQGSLRSGGPGLMNWNTYPEPINLSAGNITFYAAGVNMTQSRLPAPTCPYSGWQQPKALSLLQFGITDVQSAAWQELTLATGIYSGSQVYMAADGNVTKGPSLSWNSTYAGKTPNGGFTCTKDAGFDTFDLKEVLIDLGPDQGFSIDFYQRIHKSTEPSEPAREWRQVGHLDIPVDGMNKTALYPFILVGNMNTEAEGAISWSNIVVANSTKVS